MAQVKSILFLLNNKKKKKNYNGAHVLDSDSLAYAASQWSQGDNT